MIPLLFSCEHATCAVPEAWRDLFRGSEEVVQSSEGWEPGALNLAQALAMKFRSRLAHGEVTRLLIDLDFAGDQRWSRFSSTLTDVQRVKLVERHEKKHHDLLYTQITEFLRRDPYVVHILVHTSTDISDSVILETAGEDDKGTRWAQTWAGALGSGPEPLRVESRFSTMPAPSASLRLFFGSGAYAAIMLRVPQACFLENQPWRWDKLKKRLLDTLRATAEELTPSPESPSPAGH